MSDPQDEFESTDTFEPVAQLTDARFWWRVGGLLLFAALALVVYRIIAPVWQPLVWASLLGGLLMPLNERLTLKLNGRRALACAITTLLTILFFVLPLAGLAGAVVNEATQMLQRTERIVPRVAESSSLDLSTISWLDRPLAWLDANTSVTLDQLQGYLVEGMRGIFEKLATSGGSVVLGAVGTLASFAVMLFVLYFVLRDGPTVARKLVALLPLAQDKRSRLGQHLVEVTRAVFMGIGLTALAQGILLGIGYWLAGIPGALVFGVIAVLFALIPFVGTAMVWVPGAIYLAITGHHGAALFLVGWGVLVVGTVDNFLRPMLISGRSDVPTLAVFVGVMGGLQAFGFIGLFLGPIVLGLLVALFRFESEQRGEPDPNA